MAENTAQILPKQFWKSPENVFFDFQNAQKLPLKTAKMSNFLSEYFDFQDHLLTFRGVNTPEIRPFKAKNKAQTLRKQLQKNFEKVQNTTFSSPKTRVPTLQKV